MSVKPLAIVAFLWVSMGLLTSCAATPVLQRGSIVDRRMQLTPQPERGMARNHVFSVREGAQGGEGLSGGGCGCD